MTDGLVAVVGVRGCRTPTPGSRTQRGAVTAEAAMVMPVLVLTVLGLVWLLTVAVAQVRITDAAREVARLVARDEAREVALARGREVAPPGTEFQVSQGARDVVVEVRLDLEGPAAVLRLLPGVGLDARAVAARESP